MLTLNLTSQKGWLVLGCARTGLAAIRSLISSGQQVFAWDDREKAREEAYNAGAHIIAPEEVSYWALVDYVVVSPGIPISPPRIHPVVQKAREYEKEIINDLELFYTIVKQWKKQPKIIGVTGTNGKSTTVSLIHHILRENKIPTQLGGNIGIPVLDLFPLEEDGVYVLEISSFQLEALKYFALDYAVVLNITPDHLDRHGSMDHYTNIKLSLFDFLGKEGIGLLNTDDEVCQGCYKLVNDMKHIFGFSLQESGPNYYSLIKDSFIEPNGKKAPMPFNLSLRGEHNYYNLLAAYAVCRRFGLSSETIAQAVASFKGLPHRQEYVGEKEGVVFINDSKATNISSAIKALSTFEEIYWLVGGQLKETTFHQIKPYLPNIKEAFGFGDSMLVWKEQLKDIPFDCAGTLEKALDNAWVKARRNKGKSVILLSPAGASFDQFKDYMDRGEAFKRLALKYIEA